MTLRKNIDKKAYGISQTLGDKSINFMLIFNAKGFSMTVMHFYEGSYIKFDLESAKSQIGDNEKSPKLTHGP